MSLPQQLALKKATLAAKWFDALAASYAADTARFLKGNQDPFANPVGQNSRQSLDALLDLVLGEYDAEKAAQALDVIIRVRAIQGFAPARAIHFIFALKEILRGQAAQAGGDMQWYAQMRVLEDRIDALAMTAFDLYMGCREKIYELKANEVRSRTFKAFARAGLVKEPPDED